MKTHLISTVRAWACVGTAALTLLGAARAFPPAPHHLIYGMVRGEMGDPLTMTNAQVILTTAAGLPMQTTLIPGLAPGENYHLVVPMDSGLTGDPYQPTALRPTVPFRMSVKLGTTTYLPIGMTASFAHLGEPAQSTRLDLTLGEDLDGDGLPDAWERAVMAAAGLNLGMRELHPGDDLDGDGLSNLDEYLAGTYAFDNQDAIKLAIVRPDGAAPYLEFLGIRGRTYLIQGSSDLHHWTTVGFRNRADGPEGTVRFYHYTTDVRVLQVEAVVPPGQPSMSFFKLFAQ